MIETLIPEFFKCLQKQLKHSTNFTFDPNFYLANRKAQESSALAGKTT